MKKVIVLLVMILVFSMSACSYIEDGVKAALGGGYNEGYDDGYNEGYNDGYNIGYQKGKSAPKQLTRPSNGAILEGKEYTDSEITVKAPSGSNYVVIVKERSGKVVVSFFVRSGSKATIGVPAKKLYVYFASGKDWYGYGKGLMFGEDTYYSKDDELRNFDGSSWTYTMEEVRDGNFEETPIDMDDFFS